MDVLDDLTIADIAANRNQFIERLAPLAEGIVAPKRAMK